MHDTVIRGGTIVDGTGNPSFTGDIAIDGDRIAQTGGKAGPGKREINVMFTDSQSAPGESWYYARVLQEDGQLAWSSPVWIKRP